jgi:Mg2+-importing ATPase
MLTGESMPVEKSELLVQNVGANGRRPELDHTDLLGVDNLCFMGTNVISGTATAVVLATGGRTYYGAMARGLIGRRASTSFERGISEVSRLLTRFTLTMVPIVFLVKGFAAWL